MRIITSFIAAFVVVAFAGCQALSPEGAKNWFGLAPKAKESQYTTPVKLATMWTPAVLNRVGQAPTRGFGGRLYFYDAANKPIPVEGQLVVYAYNDSKPGANGKTPDAKYAFTPEQFTTHFSPTELGASYSIWIPWDHVGQPQMEVSLVPIFTSSSGQLVMGQSSRSLLAGPTNPLNHPQPVQHSILPPPVIRNGEGVQAVSFQQSGPAQVQPAMGRLGVETMSLRLPSSLADRLAQAEPQANLKQQRTAGANPMAMNPAAPRGMMPAPPAVTTGPSQPGAIPPPWFPLNPPPIHSAPPKLPAPTGPGLPPAGGPTQTPPFPVGLPSSLPAIR